MHIEYYRITKPAGALDSQNGQPIFFPTSFCGVLVVDSVSRRLLLLALLLLLLRLLFTNHLSFTHHFVTHHFVTHHFVTHHLSHTTLSPTIFHTPSLSHTSFHTHPCQPPSFTHHFSHLATSTFVSRGRRGTYGTGLALVSHTIFVTHTHTIFHTPLCHTPSFTHHL